MSILGKIGKIASFAAPFALAPFTGGASLGLTGLGGLSTGAKILAMGGRLAPILGGAAKSSQQSNQVNDQARIAADRNALERYKTGVATPGVRLGQSVKASMIANRQPVQFNTVSPGGALRGEHGSITGGYANPNLISSDTKAQADDLMHQNLLAQLGHGSDLPQLSTPGQSSALDKILGAGAFGSSILGALQKKPQGMYAEVPPVPDPNIPWDEAGVG